MSALVFIIFVHIVLLENNFSGGSKLNYLNSGKNFINNKAEQPSFFKIQNQKDLQIQEQPSEKPFAVKRNLQYFNELPSSNKHDLKQRTYIKNPFYGTNFSPKQHNAVIVKNILDTNDASKNQPYENKKRIINIIDSQLWKYPSHKEVRQVNGTKFRENLPFNASNSINKRTNKRFVSDKFYDDYGINNDKSQLENDKSKFFGSYNEHGGETKLLSLRNNMNPVDENKKNIPQKSNIDDIVMRKVSKVEIVAQSRSNPNLLQRFLDKDLYSMFSKILDGPSSANVETLVSEEPQGNLETNEINPQTVKQDKVLRPEFLKDNQPNVMSSFGKLNAGSNKKFSTDTIFSDVVDSTSQQLENINPQQMIDNPQYYSKNHNLNENNLNMNTFPILSDNIKNYPPISNSNNKNIYHDKYLSPDYQSGSSNNKYQKNNFINKNNAKLIIPSEEDNFPTFNDETRPKFQSDESGPIFNSKLNDKTMSKSDSSSYFFPNARPEQNRLNHQDNVVNVATLQPFSNVELSKSLPNLKHPDGFEASFIVPVTEINENNKLGELTNKISHVDDNNPLEVDTVYPPWEKYKSDYNANNPLLFPVTEAQETDEEKIRMHYRPPHITKRPEIHYKKNQLAADFVEYIRRRKTVDTVSNLERKQTAIKHPRRKKRQIDSDMIVRFPEFSYSDKEIRETSRANNRCCYNGGTCVSSDQTNTGLWCKCPPTFTGRFCEIELDKCSGQCKEHEICRNYYGNFTCVCDSNYVKEGEDCIPRITCEEFPCLNGADCEDTEDGHFQCLCPLGFLGRLCEKRVPECEDSSCTSEELCVSTETGYKCLKKDAIDI